MNNTNTNKYKLFAHKAYSDVIMTTHPFHSSDSLSLVKQIATANVQFFLS